MLTFMFIPCEVNLQGSKWRPVSHWVTEEKPVGRETIQELTPKKHILCVCFSIQMYIF